MTDIQERVRKVRILYDAWEVPINCFELAERIRAYGAPKLTLEKLPEEIRELKRVDSYTEYRPEENSFTIYLEEPSLCWEDRSRDRRCNFTLAHELGHIFCNHLYIPYELKTPALKKREDDEADAFAAELLMPLTGLAPFRTVPEAAAGLLVSESAIMHRTRKLGILLVSRTCPDCGFPKIPSGARFCRHCGRRLVKGPTPENPSGAWYRYPKPETCPQCGSTEYGAECRECGFPETNLCMPEYNQTPHACPPDAEYCEICGAETQLLSIRRFWKQRNDILFTFLPGALSESEAPGRQGGRGR